MACIYWRLEAYVLNLEVSLWIEYRKDENSDDEEESVSKKSRKSTGTKRQGIEDEIDTIYKILTFTLVLN